MLFSEGVNVTPDLVRSNTKKRFIKLDKNVEFGSVLHGALSHLRIKSLRVAVNSPAVRV